MNIAVPFHPLADGRAHLECRSGSFGKNAPNRVEESYGDAKNLRLRHPQAALGFVFGLSASALVEEPGTAECSSTC